MFLFTRQLPKVAAFDGPGISQSSTSADKEVGREAFLARIFTLDVQRCSIGISAYEVKLILSVLYMNMENKQSRSRPSLLTPAQRKDSPSRCNSGWYVIAVNGFVDTSSSGNN